MNPRPLRSKQPAPAETIGKSCNLRNEVRGLSAPIGVCVTCGGSREPEDTSETCERRMRWALTPKCC